MSLFFGAASETKKMTISHEPLKLEANSERQYNQTDFQQSSLEHGTWCDDVLNLLHGIWKCASLVTCLYEKLEILNFSTSNRI